MRGGLLAVLVWLAGVVISYPVLSQPAPPEGQASVPVLNLVTEHYPPYNFVKPATGEVTGISTDKVLEIMRRSDTPYTISAYPWSRALQMARSDPNTCIFSTTRTAERESRFKWIGPLIKKNIWTIFARADDSRRPTSLEQLKPYVIGAYRKAAVGDFLALKGFRSELANVDSDNPRKLLYERFDFWATGRLLGMAILKEQKLSDDIIPLFDFHQVEMYLACHASMSQSKVNQLNRMLKAMEQDGTVAAIEARYR
ncbi:ABC transporter substrate-binding protein [Undibacterium sp. CY18W]|uniref:ABC transporter substrate-binding protein n=1 Tax=Undibacterium hunanense TaxID=2762292 RepID=A0ABR6ZRQ8_9BURK|nr:ABC transporter substrate-binding protein [Undibacterium hunanense]MBC3918559.1 ABC transporter substrate-binding protein [Undibacterium hunanense]